MTKILMVCLGNICRSPLAEGILKAKVFGKDVFVDSAGTGAYHVGELPDPRSVAIARANGLDLTDQRARKFVVQDFDAFDIIYAMDNSNARHMLQMARNDADRAKVHLILNEVFAGEDLDVPDPYYGGEHGFRNVFSMLDEACDKIVLKIT